MPCEVVVNARVSSRFLTFDVAKQVSRRLEGLSGMVAFAKSIAEWAVQMRPFSLLDFRQRIQDAFYFGRNF